MKRRAVKTILYAALLTFAMTAAACGAKESPAPAVEEAAAEEKASVKEEAPAEEEKSSGKTLEEYLKENPMAEKQLEEQIAAQGNEMMDVAVETVGNDVIWVATFKDFVELPENVADSLNDGMDEAESVFSGLAAVWDEAIGAEKGTVSYGIRYCDSDGNVLAENSFRAE